MIDPGQYRAEDSVIARVMTALRSDGATKLFFTSPLRQEIGVKKKADEAGNVALSITASTGNTRTAKWSMTKIQSYLESGFLFPHLDGKVHDKGYEADRVADFRERIVGSVLSMHVQAALRSLGRDEDAIRVMALGVTPSAQTDLIAAALAKGIEAMGDEFMEQFELSAVPSPSPFR